MTDINQWMIQHKYAKNDFNAYAIFNGLELSKEPRFWKRVYLILLYRRWRTSKVYNNTADCFAAALRGERPQELVIETP